MAQTRMEFIDLVKEDWRDLELKKKCLTESRKKILKGQANRAFDEFPHLVNPEDLNALTAELEQIIKDSNTIDFNKLKDSMKKWQKRIAQIGCKSLFDANSHIKQELLDLLQWKDLTDKINTLNLLCGFVGAVNQQILCPPHVVDLLCENKKCEPLFSYCNEDKRYRTWTKEEMKRLKINFVDESQFDFTYEIMNFPSKNPVATAVGIGSIAAIISLGVGLFVSEMSRNNSNVDSSELLRRPKF